MTCTLSFSWGILFSHPRDFTPVCTTELARAAKLSGEFKKRDVKMIALSVDSVEDHCSWSKVTHMHAHMHTLPVSLNQPENMPNSAVYYLPEF